MNASLSDAAMTSYFNINKMAGRSAAPTRIVDPNTFVNPMLQSENFVSIIPALDTADDCLQWLARRRLVRNALQCPACNSPCKYTVYGGGMDGRRWACQGCNFRKSVRDGSFFARSHLTLKQIIILTYCWSHDLPQTVMIHEAEVVNPNVTVDWCNFMREECEIWMVNHNETIGGMDAQGQAIVVEIDESKYFHRKYHRGQWHDGHWVFGGIERNSGKCFLVEVADRRAPTLEALILQYILPGSHIVSDGWASYANIANLNHGIYTHSVVVHQHNFVDPNDPDVHTENVENMWMRAKRKLRRQFGTSRALFPSYLHEFVYRNRFRGQDLFGVFLAALTDNYHL
jgi:hypothetical protein